MAEDLKSRIDRMFARDRLWAYGFVVVLWATLAFVYFSLRPIIPDPTMNWVILVSAILLGIFNTASIIAMITHYGHDRTFIYELDIRHLDQGHKST